MFLQEVCVFKSSRDTLFCPADGWAPDERVQLEEPPNVRVEVRQPNRQRSLLILLISSDSFRFYIVQICGLLSRNYNTFGSQFLRFGFATCCQHLPFVICIVPSAGSGSISLGQLALQSHPSGAPASKATRGGNKNQLSWSLVQNVLLFWVSFVACDQHRSSNTFLLLFVFACQNIPCEDT